MMVGPGADPERGDPVRALGRLLLGAFALVLAIPCGALVLAAGLFLDPVSREALGRFGLAGLMSGLLDLASGLPPDVAAMAAVAFAKALFVLLVLPPTLAALVGETLNWRALAWYGGASGGLAALLPWLVRGGAPLSSGHEALAAEGRAALVLFVAGAASGLVYGLIAGRGAGPASRPDPAP